MVGFPLTEPCNVFSFFFNLGPMEGTSPPTRCGGRLQNPPEHNSPLPSIEGNVAPEPRPECDQSLPPHFLHPRRYGVLRLTLPPFPRSSFMRGLYLPFSVDRIARLWSPKGFFCFSRIFHQSSFGPGVLTPKSKSLFVLRDLGD